METGFFAYRTKVVGLTPNDLRDEPLGGGDKFIFRDLKTARGVIARLRKLEWRKGQTFRVFRFTNFYNGKTFNEVAVVTL